MQYLPLAYILNWGWLRIGPPYIYLNIDPVIFHLGPLAVHWYGLMYVVGILIGLWAIRGYAERKGISQDLIYRVLWWLIAAGLIGGRLYFVVQQPDLVSGYLMQPWRIIATWEGGMAFYGAIFLIIPTMIWRSYVERINALVMIDAGVLFAAAGQIFGRIGNLINGDIIGYVSPNIPWSTVYQNPNSFACPATCNMPVQPAAAYELLINLVMLALLFYLSHRVRRPGILTFVYLFGYAITQFLVFFVRANDVTSFFGLWGNLGLKQAQWTSIVVFILLIPLCYFVLRRSKPVPDGEVALTYGIPQKQAEPRKKELETRIMDGQVVQVVDGEVIKIEEVQPEEDKKPSAEPAPSTNHADEPTAHKPINTEPSETELEETLPTQPVAPEDTKTEPVDDEPTQAVSSVEDQLTQVMPAEEQSNEDEQAPQEDKHEQDKEVPQEDQQKQDKEVTHEA